MANNAARLNLNLDYRTKYPMLTDSVFAEVFNAYLYGEAEYDEEGNEVFKTSYTDPELWFIAYKDKLKDLKERKKKAKSIKAPLIISEEVENEVSFVGLPLSRWDAKQIIELANLGLVSKEVHRYNNLNFVDQNDLFQTGTIGIYEAIKGYCINNDGDVKFSTYCTHWIKKYVSQEANNSTLVRMPQATLEDLSKFKKIKKNIEDALGREVTVDFIEECYHVDENGNISLNNELSDLMINQEEIHMTYLKFKRIIDTFYNEGGTGKASLSLELETSTKDGTNQTVGDLCCDKSIEQENRNKDILNTIFGAVKSSKWLTDDEKRKYIFITQGQIDGYKVDELALNLKMSTGQVYNLQKKVNELLNKDESVRYLHNS